MLRVEATGSAGGDYGEVEDGGEIALDLWVVDIRDWFPPGCGILPGFLVWGWRKEGKEKRDVRGQGHLGSLWDEGGLFLLRAASHFQ